MIIESRPASLSHSASLLGTLLSLTGVIASAADTAPTRVADANSNATAAATDAAAAERIARGKYLVTTAGCHDCHTPLKMTPKGPARDMDRALSGHPETLVMPETPKLPAGPWEMVVASTGTAFASPWWGVSFPANLTPDPETGLGKWTFQNFKDTIRTGRHMGRGRPILPPMPIPMYKHFTDEDLELIFVYLQSIPAVKNRVPEPLPPPEAPAAPAP